MYLYIYIHMIYLHIIFTFITVSNHLDIYSCISLSIMSISIYSYRYVIDVHLY